MFDFLSLEVPVRLTELMSASAALTRTGDLERWEDPGWRGPCVCEEAFYIRMRLPLQLCWSSSGRNQLVS